VIRGLIFLVALVVLGIGIERARVGATFSDPIAHYRSQDESLFANSAMTMALHGDWLTPKFLGRIYLFKPPLQLWLSGISMKLLGVSLLALRLPMLIAGALGVLLVYIWGQRGHSLWAGAMAAILLLSDPMWHIFSRLCYTDLLLAVFISTALYCVFRDPRLESRFALVCFALSTAAAIMTKSIAGLLPILALAVFAIAIRSDQRPTFWRIVQAGLLSALFVAPWHIYQALVHPRWFWADYVQIQLLGYGVHPPFQVSSEFPLLFYAKRLFLVDPILCILALIAIPSLWMAIRRRDSVQPILLTAWLLVVLLALSSFQARGNFRWVVFLLPPLCLLAAGYGPLTSPRWQKWLVGLLCVIFAV